MKTDASKRNRTTTKPKALRDAIEQARLLLGWESMETHRSDSLDFHDMAVWMAVRIIEIGYEAGRNAATKNR